MSTFVQQVRHRVLRGSSAEKVAMLRAYGALERDSTVRNPDFLARDFLADSALFRFMIGCGALRPIHVCGRWGFERIGPGAYWMEIARVKHFDEILLEEVSRGVKEVVILGAGLDSRAYRFADQMEGVRVIEVDHPEMAAHKRARLKDIYGELPSTITYLPLDLAERDLADGLAETSFDPSASVLVLWIGVSMYLSPDAVSAVLRWTGGRAPDSSIGFDYFNTNFFESEGKAPRRTRRMIERSGERLDFGLDPEKLPAYLGEFGLTVRSHLVCEEIERAYLLRGDGKLAGQSMPYAAFVHAAVAPRH